MRFPECLSGSTEKGALAGVAANTYYGSQQHINVNGNIISAALGIDAKTYDLGLDGDPSKTQGEYCDSRTDINVSGNITADLTGIAAFTDFGAENHIEVTGSITVNVGQ